MFEQKGDLIIETNIKSIKCGTFESNKKSDCFKEIISNMKLLRNVMINKDALFSNSFVINKDALFSNSFVNRK